jgi:FPC/CPF motif-containing protein YcgG
MEGLPELHPQTTKALVPIRDTLARIKRLPPDYDFQLPTLISNADDYSDDLPYRSSRFGWEFPFTGDVYFPKEKLP